jgi:hypothetical protein
MSKLGRPSEYRPEYVEQMLEYFGEPPYTKDPEGKLIASDMKTLAGFAIKIGVHRDTLHEWANKKDEAGDLAYPDFSDAYRRAKDFQENFIAINGNRALINPNFAQFTAMNVIGWNGKNTEVKVDVNNNITQKSDDDIEKRYQELLAKAQAKPEDEESK